jgi:S-adenosylmethionine:tRNA ribosyltransferase-isomerase
MRTDELDFDLPAHLIAQTPPERRGDSRLMHYRRADRTIEHRSFHELADLLRLGDLLVFNNARVIPARFNLAKSTGGRIEALFLSETSRGHWRVLLKNLGNSNGLLRFSQVPGVSASVKSSLGAGEHEIEIDPPVDAIEILERIGRMPLPPYIRRDKERDERDELDRERYQTVFACAPGAVAAPTASLHFTPDILKGLKERGVETAFVTLHVGLGTFKPVTAVNLDDHAMHSERYSIEQLAADALNAAKTDKRRIIAVGTTAARVLESQAADVPFTPRSDQTSIFIRPPYVWKHINALITNFHLPRSTLIALVGAMIGVDEQRRAYRVAIERQYRFFSYGDAMFID